MATLSDRFNINAQLEHLQVSSGVSVLLQMPSWSYCASSGEHPQNRAPQICKPSRGASQQRTAGTISLARR